MISCSGRQVRGSWGGEAGWFAPKTDAVAVWRLFTSSYINILLISVPLGFLAKQVNWGAAAIFGLVPPSSLLPTSPVRIPREFFFISLCECFFVSSCEFFFMSSCCQAFESKFEWTGAAQMPGSHAQSRGRHT